MAVLPHQSMSMLKVKSDHRSKFSNLSNWKDEAWKTSVVDESEEWSSQEIFQFKQLEGRRLKIWGLQRDSNPWPPRYRCDARPTERRSHTLGGQFVRWLHISVDWASHRYREGHGFESRWSPDIFRLLPSNFLNWKNLLRRSLLTFIYNCSTNMIVICISQWLCSWQNYCVAHKQLLALNWPFSSSLQPLFQNESVFVMNVSFHSYF